MKSIIKEKIPMKIRKAFVVCLSALLFAVLGCNIPGEQTTSSEAGTTANSSSSPGVGSPENSQPETFWSVSMATEKVGYAVTKNFHLLRTENGWVSCMDVLILRNPAADSGNPAVFALNENTVYAAFFTDSGIEIEKSADAGKSWSKSRIKMQTDAFGSGYGGSLALSFIGASEGFLLSSGLPAAGQMEKALYWATGRGNAWSFVGRSQNPQSGSKKMAGINGYTTGMSFFGSGAGYITCTYHGQKEISVYRTNDNGESWSSVAPPIPGGYTSLVHDDYYADAYPPAVYGKSRRSAKMELYFCHGEQRVPYIYSTRDGGATWKIDGRSNLLMRSYCFTDEQNGFGLDEYGVLYNTKNGGFNWIKV